jgi:hypothetical protein
VLNAALPVRTSSVRPQLSGCARNRSSCTPACAGRAS